MEKVIRGADCGAGVRRALSSSHLNRQRDTGKIHALYTGSHTKLPDVLLDNTYLVNLHDPDFSGLLCLEKFDQAKKECGGITFKCVM